MIYFDNAATGGFKHFSVTESAADAMRFLLANPSRSGHRLAATGLERIFKCRKQLNAFFGGFGAERVIFTKNCTEALNIALLGCLEKGAHVVVSAFEHNSVLRPLSELKQRGIIDFTVIYPKGESVSADEVERAILPETKLCVLSHGSNVTGSVLKDAAKIGTLLRERGVTFVLDCAQTAGHIPIDMRELNVDILCTSAHKALGGIMGAGVLMLGENVNPQPIMYGGTGSDSMLLTQPRYYPDRLESGTCNLPAICALSEAVIHCKNNVAYTSATLAEMTAKLIGGLSGIDGLTLYSKPNPLGIVSFALDKLSSVEVAEKLNNGYDIAVRGGFHCAPLCHRHLGTEDGGLIRASLAVQNTFREINVFVSSVAEIAEKCR